MGKNYKVGRNRKWEEIPESGEMHEWEEITEPAKVQEWERFPSAGKLPSAAKLQFRGEFAKVRKTTKSSWSICGVPVICLLLDVFVSFYHNLCVIESISIKKGGNII